MSLISGLAVVIFATAISTWINDHVYTGDYMSDEV
jgi:hypothetical protein